ncbi:hypothetical protein A2Z23_02905 [Candidatus Curtissbacteria bacterium RBG_16_39_7]|uniref:Uncharacterized protein n=1 Tax=Candidatus Curtissbacteria bacterium RBG_16_39_7 TaxID=1797707 RepID=A0A1F5G449_9BACT|nr:MAG: hypothetical protein A2Z23_02905 [Candidatus Curtissbacteria bacterium RBG_16_39_7]
MTIQIGLLIIALVLYSFSLYLNENLPFLFFYILAVLFASTFLLFFSKKRLWVKIPTFMLGILLTYGMVIPFAFMCFDECPRNSRLIFTLGIISIYIYSGVFIWQMFKNRLARGIVLLISAILHLLILITSTPFGL